METLDKEELEYLINVLQDAPLGYHLLRCQIVDKLNAQLEGHTWKPQN